MKWERTLDCPRFCEPRCHGAEYLEHERAARETFVYWLFDASGQCLYVGQTSRPETRWQEHRYQRPEMFALVVGRRMAGPYDYRTAIRIEREQQDLLNPLYDRRLQGIEQGKRTRARKRAEWDARAVACGLQAQSA